MLRSLPFVFVVGFVSADTGSCFLGNDLPSRTVTQLVGGRGVLSYYYGFPRSSKVSFGRGRFGPE